MDFRQFTFLVRQPSAALRAREHFWGLPKRGVALILANALFWQPLLVRADGIVVSGPGTSLGTAGNGVPIINIAAPNGSGLSHNQFNDYNVGANGVILNNGINRTQETQLGGIILGNPNLKGNAANIILNEVNGGSPSQLRGYTEVAGQSAHVIVANPYGISCNGCGFINTPNVTLTTGKPILDNGRLDRYQVDGGTVSIDGQNLNVSNVDRFEIITRSARINAQINARELTVIAGRNTVDAKTLATTARADDGSAKPELAIDSSALGGMYAGAIKLVGTEAGVGVKLYGPLAASGGDIHIDANGQLILAQAAASGAIAVNAASLDAQAAVYAGTTLEVQTRGELTNRQTLAAKDSITLSSAGRLTNLGIIEAGVITRDSRNTTGDVHLTAQTLDNNGAGVIASRTLTANTQTLNNQGGTLSARQAATVHSGTLDNQNQGRVLSGGSLDLHAAQLLNTAGLVTSNGVLTATASTLDNSGGTLTGAGDVRLKVDGLLSNQRKGLINAGAGLTVNSATLNNQNGSLQGSAIALDFGAATGDLNNTGGLVKTAGPLTLKHLRDLNNQGGEISSEQNLSLSGRTLDNSGGTLISNNLLQLRANTMLNQGGLISGWQGLDVSGASLDNRNNGTLSSRYGNLDVRLSASLLNSGAGALVSQKTLTVRAGELDNSAEGVLSSAGAHSLTVDGLLNNAQGGVIDSGTSLDLSATQLDNSTGNITGGGATTLDLLATLTNTHGKLASGGPLLIQRVVQVNNQGGELTSQGVLTLLTTGLDNRNRGSIAANGSLNITASGFVQNSADGLIYSKNADLQLTANQLDNAKGTLQSQTDLTLGIARNLDNQSGKLLALTRDVSLKAQGLDNRDGGIYAKGQVSAAGNTFDNSGNTGGRVAGEHVSFALTGALNNQNGLVESAGTLTLKTASVDNQAGQLRALGTAGKTTLQTVGLLDNRNGTLESANTDLTLAVGSLQNAGGKVLHGGTGRFDIAPSSLDNVGGRFVTRGAMTINRDNWTNSSAIQAGSLTVDVKTLEQTASGQLLASDSFVGRGSDWSNDGLIASDGNLSLTLDGAYSANGRVSSLGSLDLHAAQVNLSKTASLAGGGDTTLAVAGQFNNAGRVTSAVDLSLVAADVNNTGTLGAGESLTITATTVLNERGLIFSGEDMQLLGASLTNRYAQVYSLGNLLIARDKNGAQADLLDNRSGAIESIGKLTIAATTVNNVMDVLEFTEHEKSAATITRLSCALVPSWGCDDRGGGRINGLWEIAETDRLKVTRQSEAATLISGSNLLINAQALNNISSSISATGNLTVNAETITNQGLQEQEINSIRKYVSFVNETGRAAQMASWFTQRNSPSPSATVEADLSSFLAWTGHYLGQSTSVTQGQSLDAIIQAGGSVDLNAPKTIDNSVIRPYFAFVTAGRTATDTGAGDGYSTPIRVNAQLPPDVAQQQVNPATLPGFNLPTGQNGLFRLSGQGGSDVQAQVPDIDGLAINRVQGLPDSHFASNPHKYLIETNPALTNLKQFMGSDYLLSNLGYNPDQSQKRLGDGLYEQRLIQQAIIARTGQRFLDGQTSDAGMFKYLMDNAIGSKQQLNLAVGVSLTAEQVAALTHDIVWLENTTVNGQQVLVPVLYLAQANNRLAPNGALIAGNDVKLITGKNLNNVGTLRATNSLAASAGRDLNNSGLIEAGSRLNLLAGNNLTNQAGGIIAGRDVSLTAVNGDVLNERSVTRHQASGTGYVQQVRQDFLDTAARIEAANNLALQAGRDVNNVGGVIQSGADLAINAGRDANLLAVEQRQGSVAADNKARSDSTRQYGSIIEAGRDFQLVAGRDISAIASQIDAGRDIDMAAAGDLTLAAAANEQHSSLNTKKVKAQEDHIQQLSTVVNAGRDVSLSAGQDLTLIASRVTAGDEAYLVAGNTLQLLAAEDSDYSLYDMKKKGSFGSKETKRDEVTNVTHVGSEIKTGGDLTLESAGDQRYQAAKLNSGNDITLDSGGAITFEVVKDLRQESHEKSKNNAFWVSSKGKGNTDETVRQTQMVAEGNIAIKAVEGLKIDVKQVNQQTVNQSIDAMVKADPQLTWIKDAEARGDVDWKQVKEIHDSFKYNNSGLGPASQIVIAIVMAAVIGPMAGAMAGGGTTGAVVGAVAAGASTNATVSVVNNRGDLGAVFKDVTSSDALKGYVISGATAGLTAGFFDKLTGTQTNLATGKIIPPNLGTWAGVGQFAANQALQNSTSTLLSKALGQGGNAGDALKGALFNTLAAASFNAVGDYTKGKLTDGYPPKIIIHAMVGGLLSRATGGDFKTGALAAGVSEAVVVHLDSLVLGDDTLLSMSSQIVGVLTAAVQKDADTRSLEKAGWVAKNATQYNYLNHQQLERAAKKIAACADDICIEKTTRAYMELSLQQDVDAIASCKADPAACAALSRTVANTMADLNPIRDISEYGSPNAQKAVQHLINSNFEFQEMLAATAAEPTIDAIVDSLRSKWDLSDAQVRDITSGLKVAVAVGVGASSGKGSKRGGGAKGIPSIVEPKIAQQMGKRGWTTDSLEGVIANPSKTVVTKDTRFDPASGTRLNDPATGYVAKDGSYVVRNDRTGAIVQVSDKNDKNWVAPWD